MISSRLINEFVSVTYDKQEKKNESTHYGVMSSGSVIFDGATTPTPCITTVDTEDGDRVCISIRNNTAYITGILRRASDGTELRTSSDGTGDNSEET